MHPKNESTGPKTVPVLAIYADEARAKLEKLAKRAAKYGQVIEWTERPTVEVLVRERWDGAKEKKEIHRVEFAVTGEAPHIGDFKFLAALELHDGGVLVSAIPDVEIGQQGYDWDGGCDHCGSNRRRVHGFVVEGPDGDRKIVGRGCLRDHLGMDCPASKLAIFKYLREFGSNEESEHWGSAGHWYDTTHGVLAAARAAIELWGWRPSSLDGSSTAHYAGLAIFPPHGKDPYKEDRATIREEMKKRADHYSEEAQRIIDWGAALEPKGDYEHNLKVALASEFVDSKTFNLVISAAAAFDKKKAIEEKRQEEAAARAALPPSRHVAAPNERVDFGPATLEISIALGDFGFGMKFLHKFKCDDGPVVAWFTTSAPCLDGKLLRRGDRAAIVATVKEHSEYNDEPQTVVLRPKFAAIEGE